MSRLNRLVLFASALLLAAPLVFQLSAQTTSETLGVRDPGWKITGEARVEPHLGREALRLGRANAWFPARRFQDGTVEFDVATSARRSFIALRFRAVSEDDWEEIYLRPHKSGLPDAVQYAPAFSGGRSNWQLYHGPGETALATFTPETWTHVKVVIKGTRAALFLGGSSTPTLEVPRLAHAPREGFIGLWSGSPPPQEGFVSSISNVVIRPGVVEYTFPDPPTVSIPPGVITDWAVSTAFVPPTGAVLALPQQIVAGDWRSVASERSGLIVLDRFAVRPAGVSRITALAKVTLRVSKPTTTTLNFGFSDEVSVFLNGRVLFSSVNGYSNNFPRREGLITLDERTLYLPLRAGDNELVLAVTESTIGGWGLMGQILDRTGITVSSAIDRHRSDWYAGIP